MSQDGWIGVDLDGTLAEYHNDWKGIEHIGKPIPKMIERVKQWLKDGKNVKIMTARAYGEGRKDAVKYIEDWCEKHIGQVLPVTTEKDYWMTELWDDRAVQVIPNTGERADGKEQEERDYGKVK